MTVPRRPWSPAAPASRSPACVRRREGGAATVLALAVIGVTVIVMAAGLALGSAAAAAHRARSAADLASLAGAVSVQRGMSPTSACEVARDVVTRNGADQRHCTVSVDGSVTVTATSAVSLPMPGLGREGIARSRAGPAPGWRARPHRSDGAGWPGRISARRAVLGP